MTIILSSGPTSLTGLKPVRSTPIRAHRKLCCVRTPNLKAGPESGKLAPTAERPARLPGGAGERGGRQEACLWAGLEPLTNTRFQRVGEERGERRIGLSTNNAG